MHAGPAGSLVALDGLDVLLEQHLLNPLRTSVNSRLILGLVAFVLLAILIGSLAFTIYLFKSLLYWLALFFS